MSCRGGCGGGRGFRGGGFFGGRGFFGGGFGFPFFGGPFIRPVVVVTPVLGVSSDYYPPSTLVGPSFGPIVVPAGV